MGGTLQTAMGKVERMIMYVPVVNVLFQMFWVCPSNEQFEKQLNIIALLAALLLTISMAVPTGLSHEELLEMDAIWSDDAHKEYFAEWQSRETSRMSDILCERIIVANVSLFGCLVGVFIVYISTHSSHSGALSSDEQIRRWWPVGRFMMAVVSVSLIVGMIMIFYIQYALFAIKFPEYYAMSGGTNVSFGWGSQGTVHKGTLAFDAIVFIMLLLHSVGIAMRHYKNQGPNDDGTANLEAPPPDLIDVM